MRISLLLTGKTDVSWVKEGLELYASRLKHYAPFSVTELPSPRNAASLSRDELCVREGKQILDSLKPSDYLILLDERGSQMTSPEFAAFLQKKMSAGRDLVFAIGGPYGFSAEVYKRAEDGCMMSLSKMTFTHQMVRTIFAEQLYRAFTIIKGEHYHHE
ncbi:MAG: 23S rRNA (pseudouridine(1915)-N(3))-methyltransferase RlmH [Bacteroidales bacterium]|nr:23S rRNA (pseudouridine(1915)-N(3))-methyltransferase RlmH [Bacteroidales bacterium]